MSLQIIHTRRSHWAALQFCDGNVYLYDSAYTSISTDTLEVIAQLVHTKEQSIKIQMMNVAQQSGTTDCALYAMAVITCLALGMDPLSVILNRDELRPHLVKSLETRTISIFPVKKHRRPVNRVTKVEICLVYCHCRLPDDGQKMVCCDKCGEWYHLHCISAPIPESDNSWFCSSCTLCISLVVLELCQLIKSAS